MKRANLSDRTPCPVCGLAPRAYKTTGYQAGVGACVRCGVVSALPPDFDRPGARVDCSLTDPWAGVAAHYWDTVRRPIAQLAYLVKPNEDEIRAARAFDAWCKDLKAAALEAAPPIQSTSGRVQLFDLIEVEDDTGGGRSRVWWSVDDGATRELLVFDPLLLEPGDSVILIKRRGRRRA